MIGVWFLIGLVLFCAAWITGLYIRLGERDRYVEELWQIIDGTDLDLHANQAIGVTEADVIDLPRSRG